MTCFPHHTDKHLALALICLTLEVGGPQALAGDQTDLLSLVRAQHRAARESIRTLSADVSDEGVFPKKRISTHGKYWRSLNTVRVQEHYSNSGITDALVKDSEIRYVGRVRIAKDRYDQYDASRRSSADVFCRCDVWRYGLIEFYGPSGQRYDFDRFIGLAKSPPRMSRDTIEGHECIRLEMKCDTDAGDEWSITFWHDVKRNYLIRKQTAIFGKEFSSSPVEYEVLEFLEGARGVFVPVRARLRAYDKGKLWQENMTILSNVRVNEELSKDLFVLPSVPAGTIVSDFIEGTKYPIDENWKRIGPATRFELSSASPGLGVDYHAQTKEEPKSIAWWLLPASLLVLAAGAYRLYVRRRTHQHQTADTKEA